MMTSLTHKKKKKKKKKKMMKMITALTDAKALQAQKALSGAFTKVAIESGIYTNILQEMAHIANFDDPPVFDVQRISGPDHAPTFKCTLKLGGIDFEGEPAQKKQEAKKNAFMAALSPLKRSKISASSLDWSPFCSCGHGYMVLKNTWPGKGKPSRQFWVCPSINSDDTIDELKEEFGKLMKSSASIKCDVAKVHSAIDNLKEDHKLSASMDTIDELKGEFGKLSDSINCDVAKVHFAIDNLKEGHKLSASMDAIELKEKFVKLSASIKYDVAQVSFAIDKLNERLDKMSASMEEIEAHVSCKNLDEAISSVTDFCRSNYRRIFVGLIFVLFVNYILK